MTTIRLILLAATSATALLMLAALYHRRYLAAAWTGAGVAVGVAVLWWIGGGR